MSQASTLSTDATKPADRISRRILRQVISTDPIASRHALALAVEVARKVHPDADVPELSGILSGTRLLAVIQVVCADVVSKPPGHQRLWRSIHFGLVCTCSGSARRARGPGAHHRRVSNPI